MKTTIKIYTVIILLALLPGFAQAQQYDNIWVLGYFGGSLGQGLPALDFRYGYADSTLLYPPFDFENTNASICDGNGNLALFTNGLQIANRYQRIIAGSNNFNYDPVMAAYGNVDETGDQCTLILPLPGSSNQYYVFHNHFEFLDAGDTSFSPVNLQYSVIDMSQDSGMGVMTQKGQTAIADTMVEGTMQAVKHANGQDWWIVIHQYNANVFYAVRLTAQGVGQVVTSVTGPVYPYTQIGQSVFSADGSTYVTVMSDDTVRMASFDRCTGMFTFDQAFAIPYDSTYGYISGCAISPGSRYLYVNNPGTLFQFDLQAIDVAGSKTVVGQYDNYADPLPTEFWHEQTGPDNKIYISTGNGCTHLHVIADPDQQGAACNFMQHQVNLSGASAQTLPLEPNYYSGLLPGAPCDSFLKLSVTEINNVFDVQLYPNPTTGSLFIQTQSPPTGGQAFNAQAIIIYDAAGRLISTLPFKNEIDITPLASGVYFLEITGIEGTVRKKVMKE